MIFKDSCDFGTIYMMKSEWEDLLKIHKKHIKKGLCF